MNAYRCRGNCGGRPWLTRFSRPFYLNVRILGMFHVGLGDAR